MTHVVTSQTGQRSREWLQLQVDARRCDTGHCQLSASLLSCPSANHDSTVASAIIAAAAAVAAGMATM